jgi:hypothetical protein
MTRRDAAIAIVVGTIAGAWLAFFGFGTGSPQGRLFSFAYAYWYVGAVLLVVGAALTWRRVAGRVPRILGSVGLGWAALIVAYPVIYLAGYFLTAPHGP